MKRWIWATLRMGAIWALAGGAAILVIGTWSILSGHSRGNPVSYMLTGLRLWTPIAFGAGLFFALAISVVGRVRQGKWLSQWVGAAAGAAGGAAIFSVIVRGFPMDAIKLGVMALTAGIGAVIGGGIMRLASRAAAPADDSADLLESAGMSAASPLPETQAAAARNGRSAG